MKKHICIIAVLLICISVFNIISPFYVLYATEDSTSVQPTEDVEIESDEEKEEGIRTGEYGKAGPFQTEISILLINFGDYINKLLTALIREEVTVDKLIFNEVDAVNANFFEKSASSSQSKVAAIMRETINKWYKIFQQLAILVYFIAVVMIGIKVLLDGTPLSKSKWQDIIIKWTTGLLILFLFPYVMKYTFDINDAILKYVRSNFAGSSSEMEIDIGGEENFSDVEIEFRSPQYVSQYTGKISAGTVEYNKIYMTKVEEFAASLDFMRVMRAYAGVTGYLVYTILWLIMLVQVFVMLVIYYKRFFVIALLIVSFPIVNIFCVIDMVMGKTALKAFSSWCKEFFINVFTQSIHAITYGLTAGIVISKIKDQIGGRSALTVDWLLIIVAINFLFKGEGIVRKILAGGSTASSSSMSEEAGQMRKGKGIGKKIRGN